MEEKKILDLKKKSLETREKILDKKMEEMFTSEKVSSEVYDKGSGLFNKLKGPIEGANSLLYELELFPDKYREDVNMKKIYELSVDIKETMANKMINKIDDLNSKKFHNNNPELKKLQSEKFNLEIEMAKYNQKIKEMERKNKKSKEM